jgi:hypothetical protein
MSSLTGATAVIQLQIAGLYDQPQQLQGFAADDIFETEAIQNVETLMGTDGYMSAGFVYVPKTMNISLQADSPSNAIFDNWYSIQESQADVYFGNAVVVLRALGQKWNLTRGVLQSYTPIPATKKLIQPRKYGILWNLMSPAPV